MDFRRLRYFITIAEEENIHRASARLHIAQPALSRQLKLLEDELGVTLFDRLPRGMSLSPTGRSFFEDSQQILRLMKQAADRAKAVESGHLGTLRVGFHDGAHHYPVLSTLFRSFRQEFANVHFRFSSASSHLQIQGIQMNDLDLGFIYSWEQPEPNMSTLCLAQDDIGLILYSGHPFATKEKITVDDLRDEHFVWANTDEFKSHSDAILRACTAVGFSPQIRHQGLTSLEAMTSLVSAGLGLAIVPKGTVRETEALTFRSVEGLSYPVELLLLWRTDNTSGALQNIVRHARAIAGPSYDDFWCMS